MSLVRYTTGVNPTFGLGPTNKIATRLCITTEKIGRKWCSHFKQPPLLITES